MALITENVQKSFTTYIRKIKCPRHYILKPGGKPFLMERIPALKNLKESDAKRLKITLWRRKKDSRGQWIQNLHDYFQPEIPASFARETIFSPTHPICRNCRRCVTQ